LRIVPLLISIFILSFPAYAKYSGGTGEPNDPYQIATAADLIALGETPGDYDKHFILTANIDLDPNLPGRKVFDRAVIAPDVDTGEYYFQGTSYTGVFDGNDHTISHLTATGVSYLGLFGGLASGAEVKDLGVIDVNIVGSGDVVGGLVGNNQQGALVTRCYSTGTVTGDDNIGGLTGKNSGRITQCYSSSVIYGNYIVAGLLGANESEGAVIHCYSTGVVDGDDAVAGLVGFNLGDVTGCCSAGTVTGDQRVGGLVGWTYGSINSSFWDIQTSGRTSMCGSQEESATGCDDFFGLTTAELQTASTFLDAGWDFVGETANGPNDIWMIVEGQTYPLLAWQKYGGGTGEPNDPYLIYTAEHLNELGAEPNDYDKHFKLMADIDLSGHAYERAVIASDIGGDGYTFPGPSYTGVFDGNGHAVSNLTITGKSYLGLFGQVGPEGQIKGLGMEEVNITGSYQAIGGLVGDNLGNITASYSTGTVTGYTFVGGLVGYNNYGDISASYSTCGASATFSGHQGVGGRVGVTAGSITTCYSSGPVSGERVIGGLVGWNYQSNITNSYSTGKVSGGQNIGGLVGKTDQDGAKVTGCFWDVETSGQTSSTSGTGLTTAEMQTASTFLDAGWDFVDETNNGTEDIWWILEGQDYPRLWWEAVEE
jgi:hypothetical protein